MVVLIASDSRLLLPKFALSGHEKLQGKKEITLGYNANAEGSSDFLLVFINHILRISSVSPVAQLLRKFLTLGHTLIDEQKDATSTVLVRSGRLFGALEAFGL
jgi:hypothetical protein